MDKTFSSITCLWVQSTSLYCNKQKLRICLLLSVLSISHSPSAIGYVYLRSITLLCSDGISLYGALWRDRLYMHWGGQEDGLLEILISSNKEIQNDGKVLFVLFQYFCATWLVLMALLYLICVLIIRAYVCWYLYSYLLSYIYMELGHAKSSYVFNMWYGNIKKLPIIS